MRMFRRRLSVATASALILLASPAPQATASNAVCPGASDLCVEGSRMIGELARYLGMSDDITAMFINPAAIPVGTETCVLGQTCDWWPAIAHGLAAAAQCGEDVAMVCDRTVYLEDPAPLLDASQVAVVTRWLQGTVGQETPPPDLGALVDAVVEIAEPNGSQALVEFVAAAVVALIYAAPDVGPSARTSAYMLPVEGDGGAVLVDPDVAGVNDEAALAVQRKCNGQVGWAVWLDYSKEGLSNDILLRGSATVNEVRLLPGSSSRCPVMGASVSGTMAISATSNAGSFIASETKTSGQHSRSGTLKSSDRGQPKLVGVGPYHEWTTRAIDVTWDWRVFPRPVFHIYRSPAGNYLMEASNFVSLSGGYQFSDTASANKSIDWTCTKQGAGTEACHGV